MRALSLRQPWASLVVAGLKDVENRRWRTTYRGPILIHAARTEESGAALAPLPEGALRWLRERAENGTLPRGALLGHVRLIDIVQDADAFSPWAMPGAEIWHWLLAHAVAFPEPVPWRGLPGLFEVPDTCLERVAHREMDGLPRPPLSSADPAIDPIRPPPRDGARHSW